MADLFIWNIRKGDRVDVIYNRTAGKCAIGLVVDKPYASCNILKIEYFNRFKEKINITVDISELPSFVDIKKLNTVSPFHRYLTNRKLSQCINIDPKLMSDCGICGSFCCISCSLFNSKSEFYNLYQCESCTIKAEYKAIFEAVRDILSNKKDIRKTVYFDQNMVHIITKYAIGIAAGCNLCQTEIVCKNRFDFETCIAQNGDTFYQYIVSKDNLRNCDITKVQQIYGYKRRVLCGLCIVSGSIIKCGHTAATCFNLEICSESKMCMNHPFCKQCDKRLNYFLPYKCKGCFKPICRKNCGRSGYCTACWNMFPANNCT